MGGPTFAANPMPAAPPPPDLPTTLDGAEILRRLDALARRGQLPGFEVGRDGVLFTTAAFGEPFDHRLEARAADGVIRYSLRMLPRLPLIYAVIIALSIWPGVWLTDSMIRAYFESYDFPTWAWYLPLTVLPLPPMLIRMVRRSRVAAASHAAELAGRIAAELRA